MKRSAEVFEMVVGLDLDARAAVLDRACGQDSTLRADVESLLEAHDAAGAFLGEPTQSIDEAGRRFGSGAGDDTATADAASVPISRVIGRYKLLERIGEGGFGTVWMAEQREPVRRRVAVKIIKPGMDTAQVIARFEAERQALAMMDHPNIARVFDGGSTDLGRPYFVMEYIKGVPIVDYCDTNRLDTRARLELFTQACSAVQHAHQKGIIHRDIKPSNVMVTLHDGEPVVKVIDFGIAKATDVELTTRTLFTQHQQMIGTPAYMSPEQAEMSGLDIDTRSDVYSLGVLLYELLTGSTPFATEELMARGFAEMMRIIREEEPQKPSTRLSLLGDTGSRTAERRRVDLKKLSFLVSGDLDWIVMKCLEKDRTRRYETANGLAADIRRHLDDEPVAAGPPSAGYKLRKFVKRNRSGVIAATAILIVFLAAVTMTAAALGREAKLRREAERQASIAQAVNEFLNDDLLAAVAPSVEAGRGKDVLMRDVLDEAAGRIDEASAPGGRLEGKPLVEASIRATLGETYRQLAEYRAAEPHLILARAIRQSILGDEHPDTLRSMNSLAVLYEDQGRYDDAELLLGVTLDARRRVLGPEHLETLRSMHNLASVYWERRRLADAEPLYRETLDTRRRVLGDDHPDTLLSMNALASLYRNQERYSKAMALCREVIQIRRRVLGDEHPDTIESVFQHAVLCRIAKRFDDAARLLNQTLDARRRILGDEHPDTLKSLEQLAMVHWAQRQFRELESIERELLEQRRRRADASPADKNQYAWALLICMSPELRDPQSALRLSLEVNELTGSENTGFLDTLSYAYHKTGDTAKAIENQEKAIALLPPGDTDLRRHMNHKLATYRKALNQADGTAHGVPAGDQP